MLTKIFQYSILNLDSLKAEKERGDNMPKITLKAARVNIGMTQKDAAKRLNVSNKTLCNWENGTSVPKVDKIDAICNLYNVTYDNLIFLPDNSL